MRRTLTALVLGAGVLGAGCHETYDYVAEGAQTLARKELMYVGDVTESSNKNVNEACSNKFPLFETRAFNVTGLNWREKVAFMDICCIVERHNYELFLEGYTSLRAGYCVKMSQLSEAQ